MLQPKGQSAQLDTANRTPGPNSADRTNPRTDQIEAEQERDGMEEVEILVQVEEGCEDLPLPRYETEHASGMDLRAAVRAPLVLRPGERALVPTGIRVAIPPGYEGQVRPRSGLALRHGIILPNSPGTIDADYRGPVQVILMNLGQEPFTIQRGDRIAQLVVVRTERARWKPVDRLPETRRSQGGFGSTGVN